MHHLPNNQKGNFINFTPAPVGSHIITPDLLRKSNNTIHFREIFASRQIKNRISNEKYVFALR